MSTSGNFSLHVSSLIDSLLLFYSAPLIVRATSTSANYSHNNNSNSMSVFKSEAGGIDVEAPVSSAGFEIQCEGIQLHCWDSLLTSGKETNLSRKDFNKYLSKLQPLWLMFNGLIMVVVLCAQCCTA